MKRPTTLRMAFLVIGGVISGLTVAAITQASAGHAGASGPRMPAGFSQALAAAPMVKVATFVSVSASNGALASQPAAPDFGVYVQHLSNGYVCHWDASSTGGGIGGGCNFGSAFHPGHQLAVNAVTSTTANALGYAEIRVDGLAGPSVASISVTLSDGSSVTVPLTKGLSSDTSGGATGAFGFALSPSQIEANIVPISVTAYDAAGRIVDTRSTGVKPL